MIFRCIITVLTAIATLYFTFWVGGALLLGSGINPNGPSIWIISISLATVLAALAGRYVWRRSVGAPGLLSSIVAGAVVTGAIGFSLGFFGPIIFMPGANQGPLLGIFITGPAGFLLGAIGGWVKWAARRAREQQPSA